MAFNGASVGGVIVAPLWPLLIVWLGFAGAAWLVGATMAAALWWLAGACLRDTPASLGQQPDGGASSPAGAEAPPHSSIGAPLAVGAAAWRDRRFATLSAAFALGLFAQ